MTKIFGIGLSRTGTQSLTTALNQLGFRAVHFPSDAQTQAEISTALHEGDPGAALRLSLLDQYDAITDTPVCCVYERLDRFYPNKKFILTIREKETWLNSCKRHWNELLPLLRAQADASWCRYVNLIGEHLYRTRGYDAALFADAYDRYHAGVFEHFKGREAELLVLDICGGEGWPQLAAFLGCFPPRTAFPVENRGVRQHTGLKTAAIRLKGLVRRSGMLSVAARASWTHLH
jgi:Sulfotransferase domain